MMVDTLEEGVAAVGYDLRIIKGENGMHLTRLDMAMAMYLGKYSV